MTYYEERFQPWHLKMMTEAEPGDLPPEMASDAVLEYLASLDNSWTLLGPGGQVLWCGGTVPQWAGRHIAWSHVSQHSGPAMVRVTRRAREHLEKAKGRVDITVRADFEKGQRFAEMLGFEIENPPGIMKAYGPYGEDHIAYVRFVE